MLGALHRDRWLFAFIGAYVASVTLFGLAIGRADKLVSFTYLFRWFSLAPFIGLALLAYVLIKAFWYPDPLKGVGTETRRIFSPQRSAALILFLAISLHWGAFTSAKSMLPNVASFAWDPQLAALDAALHGGDPWRYVRFLDPFTGLVRTAYGSTWFSLIITFTLIACFVRPKVRDQFLWSFLLAWPLLGNLMAGLFLSGGPVFYERLHGDPRFADLNAHLAANPRIGKVDFDYDAILWTGYTEDKAGFGTGISAFPSMHLSIATLLFLAAWKTDRRAGIVMLAYLVFIQLGSVHTGWHYAIDGYASILLTLGLWKAVGWALARRPAPELQAAAA